MVEPVITTGAVLVGASAWFANKLLGPSMDALGEQLKAYAGDRLTNIFSRAEEMNDGKEVTALPPGFAIQFLQKASYSADDEAITDMWAGLLTDAAQRVSNRHNIFIDILSQIGPNEARFLNGIFDPASAYPLVLNTPRDLRSVLLENAKKSLEWEDEKSEANANRVVEELLNYDFGWPAVIRAAEMYWSSSDRNPAKTTVVKKSISLGDPFVVDALSRQRLIEYFDLDFNPGWASPRMDGYFTTLLGVEFLKSCRNI